MAGDIDRLIDRGCGSESGVKVEAERPSAGGPPWRYRGSATAFGRRFDLVVTLEADGAARVELSPDPPADLAERVRLMMRAAWRHASAENLPPPRRIARWRALRRAMLASPT